MATLVGASIVEALQAGDPVTVLLPADGNQPEPGTLPVQDFLVYTGGRGSAMVTSDCAPGSLPVQNAVLVDPGGGQRAARIIAIVTISPTDVVRPGTRVGSLTLEGGCIVTQGGVETPYNKYSGNVK